MNVFSKQIFLPFTLLVLLIFNANSLAETKELNKNLVGHGGPINAVSVSADGKQVLSGSLDYAVMLWNIKQPTPEKIKRFITHKGAVSAVTFLPNGNQALSGGDDANVYLWDTQGKTLLHTFKGHTAKVVSFDVSDDSKVAVSSSWDGTVHLWDIHHKKALATINADKDPVNAVLLSSDKKRVYSGGYDGKIRVWNAITGDIIKVLHNHGWPINIMRWLPNKKELVFGTSNGDVQILTVASGKIIKVLIPHNKPVLGLAVSKQHGLIASGGNDGVIRVWDINKWVSIGERRSIRGPVWALDFTADGEGLYYGSLDDEVKYWKVSLKNEEETPWKGFQTRRFQVKSGVPLGELQFARKCSVCHSIKAGDANRAGPSLHKIFGRKAGSLTGYTYSDGVKNSDVIWNEKTIDILFSKGPQHIVPGSKMPLQTIPNNEKRKALIDYLKSMSKAG